MEIKKDLFEDMFAEIPTEGIEGVELPGDSQPSEDSEEGSNTEPEEEKTEDAPSQEESKEPDGEAPEPEATEEDPAPAKDLPFHKHPRWMRVQKELRETKEANDKLLKQMEDFAKTRDSRPETETVPSDLTKVFGDDVEAFKQFASFTQAQQKALLEEMLDSKLKEITSTEEQDKAKEQETIALYEERLADLGEELGIPLHDPKNNERNQILALCEKYGIVDKDGHPDFKKADELRKDLYPSNKKVTKERKQVASNASDSSLGGESLEDGVMTPTRLKQARMRRDNMFSDY